MRTLCMYNYWKFSIETKSGFSSSQYFKKYMITDDKKGMKENFLCFRGKKISLPAIWYKIYF